MFNSCLLICTAEGKFGVVGMQTDNILILGNAKFVAIEEKELIKAGFTIKPREKLTPKTPLIFNGCILTNKNCEVQLH
ncbi:hypothetical protein LCER1_G007608, partial [Lachnellula cervina]